MPPRPISDFRNPTRASASDRIRCAPRDRNLLTDRLGTQDFARRNLAALLDLPQDITPTAATPARPLGLWEPTLQESIVAAYNFREELDRLILDISINNSQANASLAAIQPVLSFVNTTTSFRNQGQTGLDSLGSIEMDDYTWGVQNSSALTATWRLYDGGRARAEYRRFKQAADESAFNLAATRDQIRLEVEDSFIGLRTAIQNIQTTSSEVLSSRESLRLSQLRVQAGVSTQREVVDNQRDLTNAEIRYAQAIREYNTSLAELRRFTGLDALIACPESSLSSTKPDSGRLVMPIEPTPLKAACPALATTAGSGPSDLDVSPVRALW
jgi:OMF family outer membrane factor